MDNRMKAWMAWKGIAKLGCAQRRREYAEMDEYYAAHQPKEVRCKKKYRK